jgi:hypothetical protein
VREAVLATHGRSLWVLDVSPIRQMTEEVLAKDAWLFAPEAVVRTRRSPERGESGTRRFVGENPASDASIYYFLRARAKDLKISILELSGELVRQLEEPPGSLGLHHVSWDLRRAGRSGGPARGTQRPGRTLPGRAQPRRGPARATDHDRGSDERLGAPGRARHRRPPRDDDVVSATRPPLL